MPTPAGHDVIRGTLDLLILKTLALEPQHGWGISQRIQQLSADALQVGQGSLYPALQRLELRGWIDGTWRPMGPERRARYYQLTRTGRRALDAETTRWRGYVATVELILQS
jgi:transcriptional regulator